MCGLILLILGIVYAVRIPKFLKSTPAEFPGCDPALHAKWRAKELGSIYAFLIATWGQTIVFFCIGLAMAVAYAGRQEELSSAITVVTGIEVAVFLGGLIWAAVLGSQAAKMKKVLGTGSNLPPSYYPRPGQVTLQAPQDPPPTDPPAEAPPINPPPGE